MYEISEEAVFRAAHRLRQTQGEGERLHGHTWRVRAYVHAAALDDRGMVLDFADLASVLKSLAARFDGQYLNEVPPFDDVNPTAENLAAWFGAGVPCVGIGSALVGGDLVEAADWGALEQRTADVISIISSLRQSG